MNGRDTTRHRRKLGWRRATLGAAALLVALAGAGSAAAPPQSATWGFENSDIRPDPDYRFGRLANGLRFVVRRNPHPAGTVLVRMEIAAGSLDERDRERGLAHFVEHMAFQGSTHVAPGEMVRLLERAGLAFGADTNAATEFERTTYRLDLPRPDPALLDTALMLMRETASELRFDPAQLSRERGVVLSEKRDRNTWSYRELEDRLAFIDPVARYSHRLPIGTTAALDSATAARLRAFWARTYVPARTTVVVIGDIDAAAAEAMIASHFSDWRPIRSPAQPPAGPVRPGDRDRISVYLDPALPERVTVTRHGAWRDEPDTLAQRREDVLRRIAYGVINRRLQRLGRRTTPPFREAGFGTADVFRAGRTTSLVIDTQDGQWRPGLAAAGAEYHRALVGGFSAGEVAEQVANLRIGIEHAAAGAATRTSAELVGEVFDLLHNRNVPDSPEDTLAWFRGVAATITPDAALAALRRDALALDDPRHPPLIRFQGKQAPEGGMHALRQAWQSTARDAAAAGRADAGGGFAYTNFGPAGTVVADIREPQLAIREVRFANGVRLNLKHTSLDRDQVLVEMNLDGGAMLATRDNPLAVTMAPSLAAGGLGRHSLDELQSTLAGHAVQTGIGVDTESFVTSARTTPGDLALQLQLLTALVSDPGYRPEGEVQYRNGITNWFAQLRATPASALATAIGGILSDNDPRFTTQPAEAYAALGYQRLRRDIGDRLAHGAVEIGVVGDIDEDAVIGLVARTLGALPPREAEFRSYDDRRERPWSRDRSPRVITHTGPADQALIRVTWLTRDDSDPVEKQVLNLLDRVMRIELTDALRQRLGKTYSPSSASELSRTWKGYGTFAVSASVDVTDLAATRAAIAATVAALRDRTVPDDLLLRARAPLAELFDNQLKTNAGWLAMAARAQTQPERIDRQIRAHDRLLAVTAADVQAAARRYLTDERMVDVTVLPQAGHSAGGTAPRNQPVTNGAGS